MKADHLKGIKAEDMAEGSTIFKQGDAADEQIYFLFSGHLSVSRKRADGQNEISEIHPGTFFGEVALVNRQPHHMTVTVTGGPARVGIITRILFEELCNTNPDFLHVLLRLAIERLLRADDKVTRMTQGLDPDERSTVEAERRQRPHINIMDYVNSLLTKLYHPNDIVFRENDKSDERMYFVFEGTLAVLRNVDGKEEKIGVLGADDFFGEMALINNQDRAATVMAETHVKLGILDHLTFLKIARSNPPFLYEILKMVLSRLVVTEHVIDVLVANKSPDEAK